MKKLLFYLVFFCSFVKGFSQSFPAYFEPFTDSTTRMNDIVFGGTPNAAFLTADPKKPVKDPQGSGVLRLTNNDSDQKGYIYSTTSFSSSQGFSIQFEYFTYAGRGNADGITFFLFDAAEVNNFSLGGFGGSLGYAPYINNKGEVESTGLRGGYIGIGLDEFGNFKMKKEGRNSGIEPTTVYPPPNSITIRANQASDYFMEKNVQTETEFGFKVGTGVGRANDQFKDGYRRCTIELESIEGNSQNGYYVTVKILVGGAVPKLLTVIDRHPYRYAPPSNLMYGIASSTGDETNIHEIRNLRINSFDDALPEPPIARDDIGIKAFTKTTTVIDVLANDTVEVNHNIPKDQVFVDPGQSVNGGTLTVDPLTGKISYRPKDGFFGNDTFTYYVQDERGLRSNTATVYINVPAPPVGRPDFATVVFENETQLPTLSRFDLTANDVDKVGVTYVNSTSPSKSADFFWHGDGTFTYRPVRNNFEDSFYYQIRGADGQLSDSILVTIKILYKPVAVDDKYYVTANTMEGLNVGINDYDKDTNWDHATLQETAAVVTPPANATGDSRFLETGWYLYTSRRDFVGVDEFTYRINDETQPAPLYSDPAKVTVHVYPKPLIGVAKSASYKEAENSSYDITYKIYIKNLNPTLSHFPSTEQMVLTKVGITEDLSRTFGGTDFTIKSIRFLGNSGTLFLNPSFTGKRTSAQDVTSVQLLNQTVSKLNPGVADSVELVINVKFDRGIPWSIDNQVEATAEFELLSNPASRIVRDQSYDGIDPNNSQPEGKTTITLPIPEKPEVKEIRITRYTDDPALTFEVINDYVVAKGGKTINRSSLTLRKVSGTNVEFAMEPDFKVKFTQNGTVGFSVFAYKVKDALGVESDEQSIIIEVKPVPTGNPDVFYTLTNRAIEDLNILANDGTVAVTNTYDIELEAGSADLTPNSIHGSYTYRPPADQYGQFSFSYKLKFYSNPDKKSASIPVTIYVNNPPVGTDANLKTAANTPISINITALATDVDGSINRAPGSVKILNADLKGGTLVEDTNNPGTFIFTPKANFSGTVLFRYTVEDDNVNARGVSEPKLITIIVDEGVIVTPTNKIGLSKHLAGLTPGLNGSFDVHYTFTIKNYGQEVLNNVSLTDDLGLAFNETQFQIRSLTAQGSVAINSSYNGFAFTELLDKLQSTLQPGASATVDLVVNVKLLEKEGIFINTAIAEADPAGGGPKAVDQSTSGTRPDPAGDGDVSPKDPTIVELLFPRLFIPGGFSPNNDGTNDVFVIRNAKDKKIAIEIFNRWGNRVYKSADYQNDWDGKCTEGISLGQDLPPGTYFYIIILDNKDKYTGHITLNR